MNNDRRESGNGSFARRTGGATEAVTTGESSIEKVCSELRHELKTDKSGGVPPDEIARINECEQRQSGF